jgi:uncharacterized protein (DUF305 family)
VSDLSTSEPTTAPADPREGPDGGSDVEPVPPQAAGGGGDGSDVRDGDGDGDDDGRGGAHVSRLSWGRVAVLGAALAFLGFAVGMVVTRDRPPGEGSVDVGFTQDMITHHQQALGVATLEVAYGEDPVVRSYAREVLTFQSYEVGVMTETLDGWGYATTDRSDEAMGWMAMPVPVDDMPGLLPEDQLDAMDEARGAEADRLFLELMAEHHRGGLHMAADAAEHASDGGVRTLAASIARNQAQEINEYRTTAERNGFDVDIAPADVPPDDLPS